MNPELVFRRRSPSGAGRHTLSNACLPRGIENPGRVEMEEALSTSAPQDPDDAPRNTEAQRGAPPRVREAEGEEAEDLSLCHPGQGGGGHTVPRLRGPLGPERG